MWANIGMVTTLFLLVTVFKTLLNVGFLRLVGQPWSTAFLAGVSMAQIGEFSFLLAVVGISAGVLDEEGRRLIVSVTVLSLALSPLWVITARRLQLLASYGVTEATELLRLVYGPETEALSNAAEQASSRTQRALRVTALNIRKARNKRRRKKAMHVEETKKIAADAETSPSNETAAAPATEGSSSDTIAATATDAMVSEIASTEEAEKLAPAPRKKQAAAKKPKKSTSPAAKKSSRKPKPKNSGDA